MAVFFVNVVFVIPKRDVIDVVADDDFRKPKRGAVFKVRRYIEAILRFKIFFLK